MRLRTDRKQNEWKFKWRKVIIIWLWQRDLCTYMHTHLSHISNCMLTDYEKIYIKRPKICSGKEESKTEAQSSMSPVIMDPHIWLCAIIHNLYTWSKFARDNSFMVEKEERGTKTVKLCLHLFWIPIFVFVLSILSYNGTPRCISTLIWTPPSSILFFSFYYTRLLTPPKKQKILHCYWIPRVHLNWTTKAMHNFLTPPCLSSLESKACFLFLNTLFQTANTIP